MWCLAGCSRSGCPAHGGSTVMHIISKGTAIVSLTALSWALAITLIYLAGWIAAGWL